MSGCWLVSRPALVGVYNEVCATEAAALAREAKLRATGVERCVAWFCTDVAGPWGGGNRDESHRNGPVAAEQSPEVSLAVPEPLRATGYEMQDWQRRAFQAVRDEGISA